MKKSLGFLQEARLLTMPWGSVGDQLEEEGPELPWIFKKACPHSQGILGSTTIATST
jgi:hypothetical protein